MNKKGIIFKNETLDNVIFNRITHSFLSESGETHSYLNVNDGNYTVYTYANPITQEYVSYSESIADSYYSAFDTVSQMYSYIAFDRNDVMTNQSITVRDGLQTILDVRIQPNSSSDKFDYSFKYNLGYVDGYDQMTFTENPFINRTSRYVIDFTKESSEVYFNPYSTIKYNYLYYSCYLAMTAEYENTILTKELYELSQTDVSFTHLTYEDFETFMNSMTPNYYKNLADVQSTKDVIIDITIQFNTDYIIE